MSVIVNMRKTYFIYIFLFIFSATALYAQEATTPLYEVKTASIVDELQKDELGKGRVEINQSPAVRSLLGMRKYAIGAEPTGDDMELIVPGFRAQVFSGNLRTSKDEAFNREKEIKELFPQLPTYVTFVAPFWRLRVGDYRSHEEAHFTMRLLKNSFANYAKEMYIVREDVKIPLY